MTSRSDSTDRLAEALEQAGQELSTGADGVADEGAEELSSESVAVLVDEAFGDGRRLARLGDCSLMASIDGLSAFLRGQLPADTTHSDVMQVVEGAGICFGVIPGRIHEALPRRRPSRGRRERRVAEPAHEDLEIARGQAPTPPRDARVDYLFELVEEAQATQLRQLLQGSSLADLKKLRLSLPFVRAGQELARIHQRPGKSGRNVFGEEVAPPVPPEASLAAGDNVSLSPDGETCTAVVCGYACVLEGAVHVVSPLWVSKDLMSAYFVHLPPTDGGQTPLEEDIRSLLEQSEIVHGVDESAPGQLCRKLEKGEPVSRCTLLARGTDAVQGTSSVWEFPFHPDLTRYYREIERMLARARRPDDLRASGKGLSGLVANAGGQLAASKPGQEGKMGRDVFGEEFMPDEPREEQIEAGDHVAITADGQFCNSEIYGYVGVAEGLVSMLSPLWIDPSLTSAWFLNLPQLGDHHHPSPEEVDRLLELADVRYGVDHRAIGMLCEKIRQDITTDLAVAIARSQDPTPGVDGHFEFALDIDQKPGLFLPDGSVDFRQLNVSPTVQPRDLLGVRIAAHPGTTGTDLWQREIAVRDGEEVVVDLGKNVRTMKREGNREDEPEWYLSEIEGELNFVDRRYKSPPQICLAVHQTMVVPGDVDFGTGNIDFPGNVKVGGTIRSGFVVKAEANVTVGDSLDPGSAVEAGGNVAVRFGISGSDTRVTAAGSVFTKFINGARVRAGDSVAVGAYIQGATVKADREVVVSGGGKSQMSGAIIGGLVLAGQRVVAQSIGSPAGESTNVVAGVDPTALQRIASLQLLIDRSQAVIDKILRALEVEGLDKARIKSILVRLLMGAKGARRKAIAQSIKNLMALQARCDQSRQEKQALEETAEQTARDAAIEIAGTVAVKSVLRIGSQTRVIRDEGADIRGVTFALHQERDGKPEIRMISN